VNETGAPRAALQRAVRLRVAGRADGVRGVAPIVAFIASMNARTFGDGSRVAGYTA